MALWSIGDVFRHPTKPAPPPPLPGILAERDKKYGSPIPLVIGRGVVSGQVVYQGVKTAGAGSAYVNGLWQTLQNRLGQDVVIALCEAPVTSVVQCYRRSGSALLGITAADILNRLALGGGSVDLITAATATAWSQYVGTSSEGLAHSGTAHVRIHKAHLADDGSFPETKWEVQGAIGCLRPVLTSATPSGSGGTLAAGTYYYKVAAILPSGETPTLNELSATTSTGTSSVALVWTAVPGATGYKVFGRTGPGTESQFWLPGNVTTWTDTGSAGTAGTTISTPDAEAADFLVWLLTDTTHGLGFDISMVNVETGIDGNAASSYRRYTRARGWYFSRVIEQGDSIASIIEEQLAVTNSTLVWVDGKLTAVPLDDENSSTGTYWPGHGTYPYTAVTSYVSVGDAEFAVKRDPVQVERQPRLMVPSIYPIDYTLRVDDSGAVSYAQHHAEWQSDVFSSANGIRRADAFDFTKWILTEQHAWFVSYLTAQRIMYHRSRYTFRGKPKLGLLAPGDFLQLSDSALGLSNVDCRVETAEEQADGVIEITALEWPRGSTKGFTLGTTTPVGRWSDGAAAPVATYDLQTTPPNVVPVSLLTASQVDKDNLWPNPSSEIAPPAGADTTQPEWADRYNAGAGGYSGPWVRQVTGTANGFWIPCSPGALLYAEAQAKRTAGTGSGASLQVGFYSTLGNFGTSLATSTGAWSSSATWAKVSVSSAAAPAGANAAYIAYEAAVGDTCQFDALLARRVMQAETVASENITANITAGSNWTKNSGEVRRSAGFVMAQVRFDASAGASWTSVFTLPVGARPVIGINFLATAYLSGLGNTYVVLCYVNTSGVVSVTQYDDGAKMTGIIAAQATDFCVLSFSFPWI